jgi:hypothetical protein
LKLSQLTLKTAKFRFETPSAPKEESKGGKDNDNIEGGVDDVEEELDNKELADEDLDDAERPREKGNADAEDE